MLQSAGWVLAAGALEAANEAVFAPLLGQGTIWQNFNWRIIPATAVMAGAVSVIEKASPKFGVGLGILVFASVLLIPYGNAPTPVQNLIKVMGYTTPEQLGAPIGNLASVVK
jgi:hypothetical protein